MKTSVREILSRQFFKYVAICLTFFLLFFTSGVFATHERAGEITYECVGGNIFRYKARIVVYVKTSAMIPRDFLLIQWGDGSFPDPDTIPKISEVQYGTTQDDISIRTYEKEHQYAGYGTYIMSTEDPNRNGGVCNIPGSVNIPFYIESMLKILPGKLNCHSPVLLQPPVDKGTLGQIFIHNPAAYDADGDSLSYELVFCKGAQGFDIPGYTYPPASTSFSIGAITGNLVWDVPNFCCEYNVAFLVKEWRDGTNIGYVTRDMQIDIECNNPNHRPIIQSLIDTCVEAGKTISFPIIVNDPDNDPITLTATGGPILLNDGSVIFNQPVTGTGSIIDTFTWHTNCTHVRKAPYQVTFRAKDSPPNPNDALADLESVFIKIVGPAPKNPVATPFGNSIILTWNQSECPQAIGYKIYRRNSYYGYFPGYCQTGVPAYTGYVLIDTIGGLTDTTYTDDNNGAGLIPCQEYCYILVAFYPDGAESYASVEVCSELIHDLPVITNVSIDSTDVANGRVYVAWSPPAVIDSVLTPGPFKYFIYRSDDFIGNNFALIDSSSTDINDTTYTDVIPVLNTTTKPYSYKIEFWNDTAGNYFKIGFSQTASSVYLSIQPSDTKNILTWEEHVPWTNYRYVVYRFNGIQFDSIAGTTAPTYTDSGLINGINYCYRVKSVGRYSGCGFIDPLENYSQEKCATPIDIVPPCSPVLNVDADCIARLNLLVWNNPNNSCADDVAKYEVYYRSGSQIDFVLIATLTPATDTIYTHSNLTTLIGCYRVIAIDSTGNASLNPMEVCVDSCTQYNLPNVFSPDGDNVNDLFHPCDETTDPELQKLCAPYRNIKDVDMRIFNRWGQMVYETTDRDVNWNGKLDNTKGDCPDGVYFYVCGVNEIFLNGIRTRTITGFVHLIRKK